MKRGFTLLEIIIVIIIIGVLATLGFTQYGRMVERSRGAEARAICGDIRKFAMAYYLEQGTLDGFSNTRANIGTGADQIPGPAAANCRTSHYFFYAVSAAGTTIDITATRCTSGGKTPNAGAASTYTVNSVLSTGVDTVAGTGNY